MRGRLSSRVLVLMILSNVLRITGSRAIRRNIEDVRKPAELGLGNDQRSTVTEEEISYIASTLQPRECLSLLHLLNHAYNKRRRKRKIATQLFKSDIETRKTARSAQITPCETMLLNYWRNPNSRSQRDCLRISRTLRQVRRDDLARWLCARRPSCSVRNIQAFNGTNDVSSLTAQMQVVPIYSVRRTPTDRSQDVKSSPAGTADSSYTFPDSMMWIYIALAVCTTAAVLLCLHYLFRRIRKSSQYIALADRDMRNMQFSCGCMDKDLSLSSNKKERFHLPRSGCGCSGNH